MNLKRAFLLLLVVLMLLSVVACAKGDADTADTTTATQGDNTPGDPTDSGDVSPVETTTSNLDENGYQKDDIPDDINYGGKVVNILFDQQQMDKTYVADQTGDVVNDALFARLQTIEERLGVTLEFLPLEGAWAKRTEFAQAVARSVQSGDKSYDLVCAYNLTPPTLAVQGMLTNLYDLDGLNFDQPWWPKQLLTESVYEDRLFFCADNSSWNVIRNMHVIAYNKQLVESLTIPDPMKTVIEGNWTMDLLEQYIANGYKDLNGNGAIDVDGDQFALATDTSARLDGYFFAAGLHITTFNETGTPVFALGDESVQAYVERMVKLYNDNSNVTLDSKQYKMFKEERAVFYETAIAIADQRLEFDYGMLPVPKFNPEQDGYVTGMSNTYDMWCIPNGVDNEEMCAVVLECFASEAYRKVTPAYFETALKVKYASSGDAGEVFDIIRAGMTFDFGYVYGNNFSEAPFILVRKCITENNTGWASKWASAKKVYEKQLESILTSLTKY